MNTFFIAGEQRSGTTLLSVILSRHSGIYIDGFSIGFRLVSCYKHYSLVLPYNLSHSKNTIQSWLIENDYKGRLASFIDYENLETFSNARAAIQDAVDRRLADTGKKVFGDKSPGIHNFMSDLLALMPETRFIHVVRDGRAVAHSQHMRTGKNLLLAAQDWMDGNVKGLSNQAWIGKEKYLIVKYEDLVSSPEKTVRSVCKFLGLSFEPGMISEKKVRHDSEDYVMPNFETSKINEYQTNLTKSQIRKIEKIVAPLLKKFNYELINEASHLPHRQLSLSGRIWLNQIDNVKSLFVSKRSGMHDRKNIDVYIPIKVRLKSFLFELGRDFLPEKIFRRMFRRRWVKDVYMRP